MLSVASLQPSELMYANELVIKLVGGGRVGTSPMTSSASTDLDPAKIDQLLKHKRKKWRRAHKNAPVVDEDEDQDEDKARSTVNVDGSDGEEIDIQSDLADHIERSPTQIYQWVVIMEHQRGSVPLSVLPLFTELSISFTFFNIPHYSMASLLPNDPPPFQVHDSTREQPWAISTFDDYTLPSPVWLWVSRVSQLTLQSV
jgi:hypothetical protein